MKPVITVFLVAIIVVAVVAVVADRAISKGKNVTLQVPRFMTLTATAPKPESSKQTTKGESAQQN